MSDDAPTTWRAAADGASFRAHRPIEPVPDAVWLGGFGISGDAMTSHLGVSAMVDGSEIEVGTEMADRWSRAAGMRRRLDIVDAIRHHLREHEEALSLPLELRVEPETRSIRVDGVDHVFPGMRVAGGGRWSGSCVVGDVRITVTTTDPAIVNEIVSSDCSDLSDDPPAR